MTPVVYGKLSSEKVAEENEVCRKIVREINNFGITQRQQGLLIYLLALELENFEHMRAITTAVKDAMGTEIFLAPPEEEDGKTGS